MEILRPYYVLKGGIKFLEASFAHNAIRKAVPKVKNLDYRLPPEISVEAFKARCKEHKATFTVGI